MKFLERLSSKMAKTASTQVKEEVRNTALDLLPTAIGIGGMALGIMIFKDHKNGSVPAGLQLPKYSTITLNNHHFGDAHVKEMTGHGGREETQHIPASHDRKQRSQKTR